MADGFFASTQVKVTDVDHILSAFSDAVFSHAGGAGSTIKVKFTAKYISVELGGVEVESLGPAATCKASDVASAAHGDTLVINSVSYNVIGIHPDGTGLTVLILSRD